MPGIRDTYTTGSSELLKLGLSTLFITNRRHITRSLSTVSNVSQLYDWL